MHAFNKNVLLLSASSRPGGHTSQVMSLLTGGINGQWIDLSDKDIGYYDYQHGIQKMISWMWPFK